MADWSHFWIANAIYLPDLAARVGVPRQTIIAIEPGRYSPSVEMAVQIAKVFSVTLDDVFRYPTVRENIMKAIVQDIYGSPDVLELRDIDRPVVGDGDLLVQVHAAAVDTGVWHLMTGLPYLLRVFGYGFRVPKVRVRGREVAGRVEAVGKKVFGTCEGSFAEYASAREDRVALKPLKLTFEQAAAVPISASTALQGLRDVGRVQPGQKVLIIGAAGGVGAFAVQLAKALGADVTGVCSTTKVDLARSIGADDLTCSPA